MGGTTLFGHESLRFIRKESKGEGGIDIQGVQISVRLFLTHRVSRYKVTKYRYGILLLPTPE